MDLEKVDWLALEKMRAAFLEGSAGARDYWQTPSDLASYDQTFAQRIGWKWDYVLNELTRRGWAPPSGTLMDWGCGSGIAGRAFVDHYRPASVTELLLWDRSPMAAEFARARAGERFPELPARIVTDPEAECDVAVLSHVLTELDARQEDELLALIARATAVLWVEPGTRAASRRLGRLRERLRETFQVAAPCTHQAACGMLSSGQETHWCHHFASPPPHVFTDSGWARFAALAGIDLRSLPLSFLVLDKRPLATPPPGAVRIIGRPRVYKGHALALKCDANGLAERRLTKRILPDEFRRARKAQSDPLQVWECNGAEIIEARSL